MPTTNTYTLRWVTKKIHGIRMNFIHQIALLTENSPAVTEPQVKRFYKNRMVTIASELVKIYSRRLTWIGGGRSPWGYSAESIAAIHLWWSSLHVPANVQPKKGLSLLLFGFSLLLINVIAHLQKIQRKVESQLIKTFSLGWTNYCRNIVTNLELGFLLDS